MIVSILLAAVNELVPPAPGGASTPVLAVTVSVLIVAVPVPVVVTASV